MQRWQAVILALLLASVFNLPSVQGQTTTITDVSYVHSALFDIDLQTSIPPIILNATVTYSAAKPGYFLAAGVFDLDDGNLVDGLGSSTPQYCTSTMGFAGCIVSLHGPQGSERMQFLLTRPKNVWNLALVASLLDASKNIVSDSFSDYTFTITVESALTLIINAPTNVSVTVDGINGTGAVQLVLRAGNHTVSVPETVQLNPDTRIEFSDWSDGVTSANRSVALNYDITLTANYVTQYRLQISGPVAVSGSGWYDAGSTVQISVPSTTAPMSGILGIVGAKLVLRGWSEDGVLVSNSTSVLIRMDSPHTVEATWQPDIVLPLIIATALGVLLFGFVYSRRRVLSTTGRKQVKRRRDRIRRAK